MDFSPPAILPPLASGVLINAATAAPASGQLTVGPYQSLMLQVTGSNWRGDITIEGRITLGGSDWVQIPVHGQFGLPLHRITNNGVFYANIAGFTQVRAALNSFSGAGSVTVTSVMTMDIAPRVEQRRVNNRVAQAYQVSVGAGATVAVFTAVDVSGYPLIAFGLRGNDAEILARPPWQTQLIYTPIFNRDLGGSGSNGATPNRTPIVPIDTVVMGAISEPMWTKGEAATVSIKNYDTVAHLYDAWIIGYH